MDADEDGEFDWMLSRSLSLVDDLMMGLNTWEDMEKQQPKGWRHERRPVELIMQDKVPYMERSAIEGVAATYLNLPFRSQRMDALLVDLLVALELYAFGRESRWIIKRSNVWGWLKGRFYSAVFWAVVVILAGALARWGWISFSAVETTETVAKWLFGLETALTFASLFRTPKQSKLLKAMNDVYSELGSDGPFSARHIEERAKRATDAGVVWPAPLFALLDDIQGRGGRF